MGTAKTQPAQWLGIPTPVASREIRCRFSLSQAELIVEVDGPVQDSEEQKAFDAARTVELERAGFLVIRVRERVVRDAPEYVLAWITEVGELALAEKFVCGELRRLDDIPLP